ncbi:MAG: SGNH/GDSL hydrolase family protein [Lachnospiraceae bacterium]|nr:SGNH/GDSL hydrolase family protein [Lachnospiraceae bacterium]
MEQRKKAVPCGERSEKMGNTRRGRQNINMLLVVLIGFCVLAIIEIVYGQAQMKVERERLELEEQNRQAVEELKEEWRSLKEGSSVVTAESEAAPAASEADQEEAPARITKQEMANKNKDKTEENKEDAAAEEEDDRQYDMQIVILGDSIMDGDRTESGAADIIGEQLNAKIYNMSMGGTTAALLPNDQYNFATWDSRCLLGVVNGILGNINTDIFDGYAAGEVLKTCDFDKTDYFIIEYGVNDFLTGQIPNSRYLEGGDTLAVDGTHTYTGALEDAVGRLRERFPDAGILLVAPHYCQVFNGSTFIGDGYSLDYGYGPLITYARGAGYVAGLFEEDGVFFFNAFEDSGIDAGTADQYLADGIHMTPLGARVYAEKIAKIIYNDYAPEE